MTKPAASPKSGTATFATKIRDAIRSKKFFLKSCCTSIIFRGHRSTGRRYKPFPLKFAWVNDMQKNQKVIVTLLTLACIISIVNACGAPKYPKPDPVFNEFQAGDAVNVFVARLAEPDTVLIDTSESNSIGQLHIWNTARPDYDIIVLADDYSMSPNYQAKSRVFMIKYKNNSKQPPCFDYGIRLGDSYDSVLAKIKSVSTPIERTEPSLIDAWFFKNPVSISLERKGLFVDFVFVKGILQLIRVSQFNVFEAC